MSQPHATRFITRQPIVTILIQSAVVWLFSLYSYPLAHAIIEIYIISISISIFLFGFNSRRLVEESYTQFLAIAFLFVGTLNMLYVLARDGNNLFPGHSSMALAGHFEVNATLLLAGSMLAGTWFVHRKIRWKWSWVVFGSVFAIMVGLPFFAIDSLHIDIAPQHFPNFERGSEVVIFSLFAATIWRLFRIRAKLNPTVFKWTLTACALLLIQITLTAIFGEAYQTADMIAHLLKVFAFFALYLAMIFTSITQPFSLLLRTEKEQREALEMEIATRTADFRSSEQRFRRLAERIPDMVYRYSRVPQGHYTYVNPAVERIFGITPQDVLHDPGVFAALMPPETLEMWVDIVRNPETFEWNEPVISKMFHKDGREIWVEERATPLYDKDGELEGVEGIVRDVTKARLAEKQIKRGAEETVFLHQMSVIFNSTLDFTTILAQLAEKTCVLFDAYFCTACEVDSKTTELDCFEYAANWDACRYRIPSDQGLVGQVAQTGETLYVADTINRQDLLTTSFENSQHPLPRSVLTLPILGRKKLHAIMQVTATTPNRFTPHDIALAESLANTAGIALENARLYKQAVNDAQTKLALLKEVNHRVKNNLTAIGGLLFFEQRKFRGEEDIAYAHSLQELMGRIRGLSAVHELLSSTEWEPVSLKTLCSDVVRATVRAMASSFEVITSVDMPEIAIQSEQAHHLTLLITELTLNSMKHVTASQKAIKISISAVINDEQLTLTFGDNGSGFPDTLIEDENGLDHTSFNLLKNIITKNLKGTFSLYNSPGATIDITFTPETFQPISKW